MTPLEELQAAHKRLSELRERPLIEGETGYGAGSSAPSDLIVTLHRTIDAQLAILANDIAIDEAFPEMYTPNVLSLARAINGEASDAR